MRRFLVLLMIAPLCAQNSVRYRDLKRVIDRNTGFAHMTRGVNMYTLYALRSCVSEKDVPVLAELLRDKDRITRMAAAGVLLDLGDPGKQAVEARLEEVRKDASERIMLEDEVHSRSAPEYKPILQYPVNAAERLRMGGCR